MIRTPHTQSLGDFNRKATETLDRLNETDEVEVLTVDGQARAVLLSPTAYDELARDAQLTRDAAVMRQAVREIDEGKGRDAQVYFDELRAKLMSMKRGGATDAAR